MAWLLALNIKDSQQDFRLHDTSNAFYTNRWFFCDKHVSFNSRMNIFESVVPSVVRFDSGQQKLRNEAYVHCRTLSRQVVALLAPDFWHTNVHEWNGRLLEDICTIQKWKFAHKVAVPSLGCMPCVEANLGKISELGMT